MKLKELECHNEVVLLEFDKRFECYGDEFIFYDDDPLGFEERWRGTCDAVVLSPPCLSEEWLLVKQRNYNFQISRASALLHNRTSTFIKAHVPSVQRFRVVYRYEFSGHYEGFVFYRPITKGFSLPRAPDSLQDVQTLVTTIIQKSSLWL